MGKSPHGLLHISKNYLEFGSLGSSFRVKHQQVQGMVEPWAHCCYNVTTISAFIQPPRKIVLLLSELFIHHDHLYGSGSENSFYENTGVNSPYLYLHFRTQKIFTWVQLGTFTKNLTLPFFLSLVFILQIQKFKFKSKKKKKKKKRKKRKSNLKNCGCQGGGEEELRG